MPVTGIVSRKRPRDALQVHSLLHMLVLQDIEVIVAAKEIAVPHAPKRNHGNHRKNHAYSGNLPRLTGCVSYGSGLFGWCARRAFASGFPQSRFAGHDCPPPIILTRIPMLPPGSATTCSRQVPAWPTNNSKALRRNLEGLQKNTGEISPSKLSPHA